MSSQEWSDSEFSPQASPAPKKRRSESKDSEPKKTLQDRAWAMNVGKYQKTYSFCKECNDFQYSYKKKLVKDNEIKRWIIQMPSCTKCVEGNIEMSKTYYKLFGGGAKKKDAE